MGTPVDSDFIADLALDNRCDRRIVLDVARPHESCDRIVAVEVCAAFVDSDDLIADVVRHAVESDEELDDLVDEVSIENLVFCCL